MLERQLLVKRLTYIHMHHLKKLISKYLVNGVPKLRFEKDKVSEAFQKEKKLKRFFRLIFFCFN